MSRDTEVLAGVVGGDIHAASHLGLCASKVEGSVQKRSIVCHTPPATQFQSGEKETFNICASHRNLSLKMERDAAWTSSAFRKLASRCLKRVQSIARLPCLFLLIVYIWHTSWVQRAGFCLHEDL